MLCYAVPWRVSLALRIMRQTGLRVGDVLALRAVDIGGIIAVRERKTRKYRYIMLSPALVWEMSLYAGLHGGDYVIDCDRSTIYRQVHGIAQALGWQHISAHSVRKLYARSVARCGGVRAARQALGHTDVGTTMMYLHDDTMGE